MQFPSQHTLLTPPPTVPPTRDPSPHLRKTCHPPRPPSPYTPYTTTHPTVNHYRASQSPHQSADKRRRTTRASINSATTGPDTSPRNPIAAPAADRFRPPPIKPIGFAASREHRRQSGGYGEIPSPVVMGFDYQKVDAEQLKTVSLQARRHTTQPNHMPFPPFTVPPTPIAKCSMPPPPPTNSRNQAEALQVRATLSIKEQQEALIAQRRRDAAQDQQAEPKGLTFKDWQPPSEKPRSMPQGQQTAAHLSVNTARNDDIIAASRVCLTAHHRCHGSADEVVCSLGISCCSTIRWPTWYDATCPDSERSSGSTRRSPCRPSRPISRDWGPTPVFPTIQWSIRGHASYCSTRSS